MSELADAPVRDLVGVTGLHETLFVEAGAGTGKTTLLVRRITNLVLEAGVPLRSIAAITFTEAAAAELQSRIRAAFEEAQVAASDANDTARADACQRAIDETDLAAITTLHGFANRILGEFSVAAGLPPRVRVLDEVSSQLAHEDRWERFVDALYDRPEAESLLVTAAALEIALEPRYQNHVTMRDVATEFNQNWDRLVEIAATDEQTIMAPQLRFGAFDEAVDALAGCLAECLDPTDKLAEHLRVILPEMQTVASLDDSMRKLRLLVARRRTKWGRGRGGKAGAWVVPAAEIKDQISAVNEAIDTVLEPVANGVLVALSSLIAADVVAAADTRRRDGGLEFHDLLVLARSLLRSDPEARRALHDRYTHLLLDEFQDTDPIQIELAVLIATSADDVADRPWHDLPVDAGRLFFVGDPKQSIYRFRRADIALFLQARDQFSGVQGAHQLTTNFRTVEPIVAWVNALFGDEMAVEQPERQPKYHPLTAARSPQGDPTVHRPILLGGPHGDPKVRSAELRSAEANDVARAVRAILASPDRFPVEYQRGHDERAWRPARLDDITILLPTRTSLPFLKAALDEHDIRFRISTGTLVYDTQEVVDALAALRAIDDPSDELSLVAALRSPLYACSDVDLYRWKRAGGRWDHRQRPPESLAPDQPVALACAHLASLWRERWFLTPSAMLERLLRERRATLLAFGSTRPTDVWRRLRFLVEQARAFEESSSGGLRGFTEWAELQSGSMARVHEPLLPETDEQSLSVQTIHGSKGLEFPITILSGMTTQLGQRRNGVSVLWGDDGPPDIRIQSGIETRHHEPRADLESEMDSHERLRLAYVAATRARDHLIVSCHHKQNQSDTTYGGIFHRAFASPERAAFVSDVDLDSLLAMPASTVPTAPAQLGLALDDRARWIEQRTALLERAGQSRVTSATGVAQATRLAQGEREPIVDQDDDHADRPTDAVLVERRRGRAGSAIGSAVHGVLQLVDLGDPGDISDLVEQQAHAESVPQHGFVIGRLVQAALESDATALAARHVHHKELYVAAPVGGQLIEGYVDLLVETPDGVIVVDWKTDNLRSDADIDAKLESYELQAAAYAVAVEIATGLNVVDCRFVFLSTRGATERSVRDIAGAKQRVRAAVMSSDTPGEDT